METDDQTLDRFIDRYFWEHSGIADVGANGEFSDLGDFAVVDAHCEIPLNPRSFTDLLSSIESQLYHDDESDDATIARALALWLKRHLSHVGLIFDISLTLSDSQMARLEENAALAIQLGMAYQRWLLRPAEEMAKTAAKTSKQQKSLSKNRKKISKDKACELCEQIREAERGLDTRSVARKAATQYEQETGTVVSWETIRRHWMKNGKDWRERRAEEMRARSARLKGKSAQPSDSVSGSFENDVPW